MKQFLIVLFIFYFILDISAQNKTMNVLDYGVTRSVECENSEDKLNRWKRIKELFHFCVKNKYDMFFPEGVYDVGSRNFPFRIEDGGSRMLDCGNICVKGEGNSTVFMTSSEFGADVLQLNLVKNLSIQDLAITAIQSGFDRSGSNGISITNGWDNIFLSNILCYNLPGVDKETWVDGGKALTIQFDRDTKFKKGSVSALGIKSVNNAYGFRFDGSYVDEVLGGGGNYIIDIDVVNAFQGVSIAFGSPSKPLDLSKRMKIRLNAKLENCQQSIVMARVIGGNFEFDLNNNSIRELVLDESGKKWVSSDSLRFAFLGQAPKFSKIKITGSSGILDRGVWLGAVGHIQEKFNLTNKAVGNKFDFSFKGSFNEYFVLIEDDNLQSIEDCDFFLDEISYETLFYEKSLRNKGNVVLKNIVR